MQRCYHFEFKPLSCAAFAEVLEQTQQLTGDAPVKLSYYCQHRSEVLQASAVGQSLEEARTKLYEQTHSHPLREIVPDGLFRAKLKVRGVWNDRNSHVDKSEDTDLIKWVVTLTGHPPVVTDGIKSRGALVLRITVDYEDRRRQTVEEHERFAHSIRAMHKHVQTSLGLKEQEVLQLALSGGGMRATFFHAGVFLALRDMGLIQQLHSISSVSGGTLLAAHLALHWSDYSAAGAGVNGNRKKALARLQELRVAADSDLRGRAMLKAVGTIGLLTLACLALVLQIPQFENDMENLGGWLVFSLLFLHLAFIPLTSYFLRWRFIRLFGRGKTLREVKKAARPGTGQRGMPDCYFTCTDMVNNSLSAHTFTGFISDVINHKGQHQHRVFDPDGENELLGNAVYASAAYPVLWPFRRIDRRKEKFVLADGGLSDNTGLEQLMGNVRFNRMTKMNLPAQPVACVIASDAATALKVDAGSWDHEILHKRVPLAIGVMMEIRSRSTLRVARNEFGTDKMVMPHIDYEEGPQNPGPLRFFDFRKWSLGDDIGRLLSLLRTDFNRFDNATTLLLIRWGYVQTVSALYDFMNQNNGKPLGNTKLRDILLDKPLMICAKEDTSTVYLRNCLGRQCSRSLFSLFRNLLPTYKAYWSPSGAFCFLVFAFLICFIMHKK